MFKKNPITKMMIIIILLNAVFFMINYKREQNLILMQHNHNDELLKYSLEEISQQLLEYNNDESKDNISKASTLSYTINAATNYFFESSHYNTHSCELTRIFSIFEENIKDYNMNKLLDSSILLELSSLFNELSLNIDDPIIGNKITSLLYKIWTN